jgi:hypothetical protein
MQMSLRWAKRSQDEFARFNFGVLRALAVVHVVDYERKQLQY